MGNSLLPFSSYQFICYIFSFCFPYANNLFTDEYKQIEITLHTYRSLLYFYEKLKLWFDVLGLRKYNL